MTCLTEDMGGRVRNASYLCTVPFERGFLGCRLPDGVVRETCEEPGPWACMATSDVRIEPIKRGNRPYCGGVAVAVL